MPSDPIAGKLTAAKVQLLLMHPFFGIVATHLRDVPVTWLETGATDGRHLYYNREFVKNLPLPQLLFFVAHEVLHCVLQHLFRLGDRNAEIYGMAIDYVTNWILVKARIGQFIDIGLFSEEFTDESTIDEVYAILKSRSVTVRQTLDTHIFGPNASTDVTAVGDQDGMPVLTPAMLADNQRAITEVAMSAARSAANRAPLGVVRLLNALLAPKMDWRSMLAQHIKSAFRSRMTFRRFSRRSHATKALLPSRTAGETVEVYVAVDASYSILQDMITQMMSEVKGIMSNYSDFKLHLMTFDTTVYNEKLFTRRNLGEIHSYEVKGKGGTVFGCVFDYLRERKIIPHRLLIFTDGLPNGNDWGDPSYCPTLFVIHGNSRVRAPYGMTCYYEDATRSAAA